MSVGALALIVTLAAVPLTYVVARLLIFRIDASRNARARVRANRVFARGVVPVFSALIVSLGVVLPAFVLFEPPHEGESVGLVLLVLAALGAVQVLLFLVRMVRILRLSHRWTAAWMRGALPLSEREWGMPAFAIDADFPVVAVAGMMRPRLFVDRRVLQSCSRAELAAIAAHERAHVHRRDNLRRLLIGACEGPASAVANAWRQAAEQAADERAADTPARAIDLAAALLEVARLAPHRSLDATALSTIHDGGSLEARVRHLLDLGDVRDPAAPPQFVVASLAAFSLVVVLNWMPLLSSVHALIETIVRQLR